MKTNTTIEDPSGKQKGRPLGWGETVAQSGMALFSAIANLPVRDNPHYARDAYLDDYKKNDDVESYSVYEDEHGEQVTEIPGTTALASDLLEGGHCRMANDGQGLVANLDEYHASQEYLLNSQTYDEYASNGSDGYYYNGSDQEYDEYDEDDDDEDDGDLPLISLQVGVKNRPKLPWQNKADYYDCIYNDARKAKALIVFGDTDRYDDVTLHRRDLLYNMIYQDRYWSEQDTEKTRFWWIPQRHPIGQLLIRTHNRMRSMSHHGDGGSDQDSEEEFDSDEEYYHWWSCYEAFDKDTGNVVVFENEAVERGLDFIVAKLLRLGFDIQDETQTVVEAAPSSEGAASSPDVFVPAHVPTINAASAHASSIMEPLNEEQQAMTAPNGRSSPPNEKYGEPHATPRGKPPPNDPHVEIPEPKPLITLPVETSSNGRPSPLHKKAE